MWTVTTCTVEETEGGPVDHVKFHSFRSREDAIRFFTENGGEWLYEGPPPTLPPYVPPSPGPLRYSSSELRRIERAEQSGLRKSDRLLRTKKQAKPPVVRAEDYF